MNNSLALTPAYILHRKPYSDTSLIIDFFTLHHGRITCIAKGVKKSKTRKTAILQPFIPLIINFSGRGEVKTLRESDSVDSAFKFSGATLYSAYYVNELLLRFLQKHEEHADVFAFYAQLLKQLEQSTENTEQLLRRFEVNLLDSIGYGLQLTHDAKSMLPVEAEKKYIYEIEQGPVEIVISTSQNDAKPVISGHTLLALHQATLLNQQQLKESKDLMRFVIKDLLGGYNFKSREFFTTKF